MSYAAVASQNIPEGEMPKPDQSLLDGNPTGTNESSAIHQEEKINVLPPGTDLAHPPVDTEPAARPESVKLSSGPDPVSKGLSVAPEAPKVKVPEKWEDAEKRASELADDAEKRASELADDASKKASKFADDASKKANAFARDASKKANEFADEASAKGKEYAKKAKKELREAEDSLEVYWNKTKEVVLRPSTLGGLLGVVNVGLIGSLGYLGYTNRDKPWDRGIVIGSVVGTLALFGAEGYLAESYLETPEGKQEAQRAKEEGSKLYVQAKEVVLRPGVAGGLVGAVNVAILGTVGYFTYQNWNKPWDRRVVTAVSVGLLTLSGLEGWAGKVYVDKELPKH